LPPSPYPASLDAEQAAVAVRLLGGPRAIPIHYGGFHLDGFYETGQDELATFLEHTRHEDFHVETPDVGDVVAL
jgi:L-ascorbate metabolism protein UlaG (beta-lactamase superfamily)